MNKLSVTIAGIVGVIVCAGGLNATVKVVDSDLRAQALVEAGKPFGEYSQASGVPSVLPAVSGTSLDNKAPARIGLQPIRSLGSFTPSASGSGGCSACAKDSAQEEPKKPSAWKRFVDDVTMCDNGPLNFLVPGIIGIPVGILSGQAIAASTTAAVGALSGAAIGLGITFLAPFALWWLFE